MLTLSVEEEDTRDEILLQDGIDARVPHELEEVRVDESHSMPSSSSSCAPIPRNVD